MNAETLEALKGSIRKWQRIVRGVGLERAWANCPLCTLFREEDIYDMVHCNGCPVRKETGRNGCEGSPYAKAENAMSRGQCGKYYGGKAVTAKAKRLAQDELDFLKSLLPKEKGGEG